MSLFSCRWCWENPCVCGTDYARWSTSHIKEVYDELGKLLFQRERILASDQIGAIAPEAGPIEPAKIQCWIGIHKTKDGLLRTTGGAVNSIQVGCLSCPMLPNPSILSLNIHYPESG